MTVKNLPADVDKSDASIDKEKAANTPSPGTRNAELEVLKTLEARFERLIAKQDEHIELLKAQTEVQMGEAKRVSEAIIARQKQFEDEMQTRVNENGAFLKALNSNVDAFVKSANVMMNVSVQDVHRQKVNSTGMGTTLTKEEEKRRGDNAFYTLWGERHR